MKKGKYHFNSKKFSLASTVTIVTILTALAVSPMGVAAEEDNQNIEEEIVDEVTNEETVNIEDDNESENNKNKKENSPNESDKKTETNSDENNEDSIDKESEEKTENDQSNIDEEENNKEENNKEENNLEQKNNSSSGEAEEDETKTSPEPVQESSFNLQSNSLNTTNPNNDYLSEGGYGPEVRQFKADLMAAGFASSWTNPNENFGPETVEYVKAFQAYYGLEVTGDGNEATLNQLNEVLNNHYQLGNSSSEIRKVKTDLMNLGFADQWTNPNNNYGPETVEVVKNFQSYYGLAVNGIVDEVTYATIQNLEVTSLSYGAEGNHVTEFKKDLMTAGFATSWTNPNNNYGPETVEYVKEFQTYYGLEATGEGDEATLNQLAEVLNSPYQSGNSSPEIRELKTELMNLGFADHWTNPNNNYGPETVEVVKNFQSHRGLVTNGIIDEVTYTAIQESINAPLTPGSSGANVRDFKADLMAAGFATSWTNPNNNYGPETVEYVKEFQAYYGLEATGEGDEATLNQLAEVLNNPYQSGNSSPEIRELKTDLMNLGFANHWTNPNNNYGPETVEVVRNFQSYYGLVVNGIIDKNTHDKIQELVNSALSLGAQGPHVESFKEDLMTAGFATSWNNPNDNYGPETVEYVEEFQAYYGLEVTGEGDEATLNQLSEILSSPYQFGNSSTEIREIKKGLMILGFANHWYNPNNNYGPETVEVVKNFQRVYDLPASGIVDEITYATIQSLLEQRVYTEYDISLDEAVDIQMNSYPQTDKNYAYVSADFINNDGEVTASALNVRSGAGTLNSVVGTLTEGNQVDIISEVDGWYQIEYSGAGWVNAARDDVRYYLDPNNFRHSDRQMFQFLNLARPSGATAAELNEFLEGKGILEGMGQTFIEAGRTYGVNDIYLLSHALLETGHGTSALATGIEVNGVTVYNMFGIGAVDSNPLGGGSRRAYQEGWDTPEKAIIGGAQFIGNNYIKAGQNTLYKMRWNPDSMNEYGYASHQYATDIGWAYKQVSTMYNLYSEIGITNIFLEIPVY